MKGNPVMKAKRVTGPSPNTVLLTHVRCETCEMCDAPPLRTRTVDGVRIERRCATHLLGRKQKEGRILSKGWRPAWM